MTSTVSASSLESLGLRLGRKVKASSISSVFGSGARCEVFCRVVRTDDAMFRKSLRSGPLEVAQLTLPSFDIPCTFCKLILEASAALCKNPFQSMWLQLTCVTRRHHCSTKAISMLALSHQRVRLSELRDTSFCKTCRSPSCRLLGSFCVVSADPKGVRTPRT